MICPHCNRPMRITPDDLADPGPLRERIVADVESGRITWAEIARALGWSCPRGPSGTRSDSSRVKRVLGALPRSDGARQKRSLYTNLVLIAEAAGYDPVEVGL